MDERSNVNNIQDCHVTLHATSVCKASHLQEFEGPSIYKQSAHGGGNVFSPGHRPPLPPEDNSGSHFCLRLSRSQGRKD
jgi:hypothetical protein